MLNDLRDELSKLYPTEESARRVVEDAGLPTIFIDFDGPSLEVWHRIVRQAEARHRVLELVAVASNEYPHSQALQMIKGVFRYGREAAGWNESRAVSPDNNSLEKQVWEMRAELSAVKVSNVWQLVVLAVVALGEVAMLIKMFGG